MRNTTWTIAALALSAVACGDSPTAPEREITLYFCETAWAAYQNEGEPWRSFPSTPREATFRATNRLAIATMNTSSSQLSVYYLTAEQAKATFTCNAPPSGTGSTKQLHGSVAGVASDATVSISMGRNLAAATPTSPTFQVDAVGDRAADLVATHNPPALNSPDSPLSIRTDKFIIRRGEDHANGATMPVLDFSSSEAFAAQANALTIDALPSSAANTVQAIQNVVTQRGAYAFLRYDLYEGNNPVTTYSLPASRVADGDLHQIQVSTQGRTILFYYQSPADRTLSAGPTPFLPLFTEPASPSDHVVRIDVTSQPDYGSAITVDLNQFRPTSNIFYRITATKEYLGGTPAKWSLTVPDLTSVPGFTPSWALSTGTTLWTVGVSGVPYGFSPATARDGDIYRSANVSSSVVLGQ
jgi:hypothetical protein